jgi:signal transduction histidine kinase
MTLARQQTLFLAVALVLLASLAAMLVSNQMGVAKALDGLTNSQSIIRTVLMMRIVAGEAAVARTERHAVQWQAGLRDLAGAMETMHDESALERVLLQKIKQSIGDADELFRRSDPGAAALPVQWAVGPTGPIAARIEAALQLALGNVNLAAIRLSELQTEEVRAARRSVLRTSLALGLGMLGILVGYLVVFRRLVLAPIHQLQAATDRIARGELDHRVGMSAPNEIGELGRRFDHMAEQLQATRTGMTAANRELDAFAYSVSHDLRAPLRGMDGFARILVSKYSAHMEADALHCLQMIRDNAQQMGRLIDDLLAFSRLSQQPLKKERVDHEALVQAALQGLEAERADRRIELTVGELPAAEADPRLLKQVWVNLIGNALKYTRGKDPAVIRIGCETSNGVPVYFVQDNGVGFDMRYAHKLFGVFQRLHRAEDYEGTGVGLAVVQRIIGRHGGRIWAQAAKNQGATFFFTLQESDGDEPH